MASGAAVRPSTDVMASRETSRVGRSESQTTITVLPETAHVEVTFDRDQKILMKHNQRGAPGVDRIVDKMPSNSPMQDNKLSIDIEHAHRIAASLDEQGKFRDADQLYQLILAVKADHVDSLLRMGKIRARAGQFDLAKQLFQRAVAAEVTSADAHASLGAALATLGSHDKAIACYRTALSLRPDHASAMYGLAASLHELGRTEEAIGQLEQAVAVMPAYAQAHLFLANLLRGLNRLAAAMPHYEKVLALRPDSAEARNSLADIYQKLGRIEAAIALYEQALAIHPDDVDAHCDLGKALIAVNRHEEAIAQYRKALQLDPSRTMAYYSTGVALQALGRIDEAEAAYQRAAQISPRDVTTHLNLAHLRRFRDDDPRLGALEKLADEISALDPENQIALHFSLGKAYADLGQPERSFHHLREGNFAKRRQVAYDEKQALGVFERVRAVFSRRLIERRSGGGDRSAAPVFVVGMPRSGTTLVEQILASHSRIHGAGEIETFRETVVGLRDRKTPSLTFPEMIAALSPDDFRDCGSEYVQRLRAAAPTMDRIVNKMPMNFILTGLIHLALPNARIIHTRRDPIDTCFSCYSLMFTGNQPFTYDLGELGRYYHGYEALMQHWREVLPPGVMIEVEYEKLVDDIEGHARSLIDHCGLEWEDACLAFHKTRRPVATASALQVREPVYRTSVGRWRPYEKFLLPLIEALNSGAPDAAAHRIALSPEPVAGKIDPKPDRGSSMAAGVVFSSERSFGGEPDRMT
jgi:tetratricopeptide (TPR) repeat protein